MSKIFVVFGLVFLAGGAYAIGDGWPYLVLERGFTQVILGAISATLGILLLAIAVLFAVLQRLEIALEEHIAGAHPEPGSVMPVEPAMHAPAASIEPRPAVESHPAAPVSTGIAAAAGAVAIGAGMSALSAAKPHDVVPAEEGVDEHDRTADLFESAGIEPAAPAEIEERVVALDSSDWVDPLEADRSADPETVDGIADADSSDEALVDAEFTESAQLSVSEISAPDDVAAVDAPELEPKLESEPEPELAVPEPTGSVMPQPMDDVPPAPRAEPWWPRIQPRDQNQSAPPASESRDEFGDLRAELSHALRAPLPAGAAHDSSRADDEVEPLSTIRPWPPVTQPVATEALVAADEPEPQSAVEAPEAGSRDLSQDFSHDLAEDRADEWDALTDAPSQPATPEPELEAEPAGDEAVRSDAEPAAPTASQDGVVGSYQVGEAHFTMYADGSIQARTPEGDYVFASMDELKDYLAREKSKLEPGAA